MVYHAAVDLFYECNVNFSFSLSAVNAAVYVNFLVLSVISDIVVVLLVKYIVCLAFILSVSVSHLLYILSVFMTNKTYV